MTRAEPNRDLAGAVVLDAFATGLNAARALHRRGVRVALVAMGKNDVAQCSRAVSECVRLKAPPSPAALLELLDGAVPRWQGRVLIPASDLALETLSRYRDRLARHYHLYVPEWRVAKSLLRKDLTREAAAACGIEMPLSHGELDDELDSLFELATYTGTAALQVERAVGRIMERNGVAREPHGTAATQLFAQSGSEAERLK